MNDLKSGTANYQDHQLSSHSNFSSLTWCGPDHIIIVQPHVTHAVTALIFASCFFFSSRIFSCVSLLKYDRYLKTTQMLGNRRYIASEMASTHILGSVDLIIFFITANFAITLFRLDFFRACKCRKYQLT